MLSGVEPDFVRSAPSEPERPAPPYPPSLTPEPAKCKCNQVEEAEIESEMLSIRFVNQTVRSPRNAESRVKDAS